MPNLIGQTNDNGVAGVLGESSTFNGVLGVTTANGHAGVAGVCDNSNGNGVFGRSKQANGVIGFSSSQGASGVAGVNDDGDGPGVFGRSAKNDAILGFSKGKGKAGVAGVNEDGEGNGVYGRARTGNGVYGESFTNDGVLGFTKGNAKAGVAGVNDETVGNGVYGRSRLGNGVFGTSSSNVHAGVMGVNENPAGVGVIGKSSSLGVVGECSNIGTGVFGHCQDGLAVHAIADKGIALLAEAKGPAGSIAGQFNGNVIVEGDIEVTGDIRLTNADCAEDFNIGTSVLVEPGSVMVLGEEGALYPSQQAYDKRVAGVVSGAGDYKPGIVLDKQQSDCNRQPIALLGKVYCKVDAQYGAIEIGDLLTTSPTLGHAMKASDQSKAFGTVIGKALRALKDGQGLIPILIALQ